MSAPNGSASSAKQLVAPVRRVRHPRDGSGGPVPAATSTRQIVGGPLGSIEAPGSPLRTGTSSGPASTASAGSKVTPASTASPTMGDIGGPSSGVGKNLSEAQISVIVRNFMDANRPSLLPCNATYLADAIDDRRIVPQDTIDAENAKWREAQHGRVKTVHGLLFLCLNIGADPPDVARIEPCAKLECWVDPMIAQAKMSTTKGDVIADALESQYRSLQKEAIYRKCLESSVDDAKQALFQIRKKAKDGRVLVHYNGHGMPKATHHGEIWFFDQQHTHYIPLTFSEILQHVESPTLFVLDCNSAGSILSFWRDSNMASLRPRDMLICACSDGEVLPQNPVLPADLLTSCLTTPIKMALEWYIHYSHRQRLLPEVTPEMIRNIPGDLTVRRSPLGELQWIFTAITDTIAWCSTPNEMFYPIFRQDVLTKSLFRNFLLADKLLREVGCVPVSYPEVAGNTHTHHVWDLWDIALEAILCQLPKMLRPDMTPVQGYEYTPSSFFADQLTAFEVWVAVGDVTQKPEQLPSVLLCLSSNTYRVRALLALCRYLNTGSNAVHNTLFCGATSYLIKLFVNPEMLLLLTVVWLQILRVDPGVACAELLRAQTEKWLLRLIQLPPSETTVIVEDPAAAHGGSTSAAPASLTDDVQGPAVSLFQRPTPLSSSAIASPVSAAAATGGPPPQHPGTGFSGKFPSGLTSPAMGVGGPSGWSGGNSPIHKGHTPDRHGNFTANGSSAKAADELPSVAFHTMESLTVDRCQAIACYITSQLISGGGEKAALACWNGGLLSAVMPLLSALSVETRSWGLLLLSKMVQSLRLAKTFLATEYSHRHEFIHPLLTDHSPVVRASCCTLLSNLLGFRPDLLVADDARDKRLHVDRSIMSKLCALVYDPSPAVRTELVFAAAQILYHYAPIVLGSYANVTPEFVLNHLGAKFELLQSTAGGTTVLSALSLHRPTDNPEFMQGLQFTLQFAHKDEPPPIADLGPIAENARDTLEMLVNDAAVLLAHLQHTPDAAMTSLVRRCIQSVFEGKQPFSTRIEQEAELTMQGITTQRVEVMTEVDRARQLRNHDLARQVVLDLSTKAIVPQQQQQQQQQQGMQAQQQQQQQQQQQLGAQGQSASRADDSTNFGGRAPLCMSLFSGAHEQLLCGQFRSLEPQVVVASRVNNISIVGYELTLDKPCTTVNTFSHVNDAVMTSLHIVNDTAERPLILAIDRQATVTLYRDAFQKAQSVCLSFTVPVAAHAAFTNLVSAYRPRDAALFYGNHGSGIDILNLAEERIVQTMKMPQEMEITSIFADQSHNGKAIFAGFADGSIRFFDDRTNTGYVGLVSMIEDLSASSGQRPTAADAIVGLGTSTAPNMLYTCTATALRIFDIRHPKRAVFKKDVAGPSVKPPSVLVSASAITSSFGPGLGSTSAARQSVAAFSVCSSYPLMCTMTTDGLIDFHTHRGETVFGSKPHRTKDGARGFCCMHSMKTMGLFGGEIVALV